MLPVMKSEMQLIVTSDEKSFISLYSDEILTKKTAEAQFERLKKTFGNKIPPGFFDELSDAIRRNNFTNQKLIDAITKIIETEEFPSVNKIINHDKRIRLLTRDEFLKETNEFSHDYKKYYQAVKFNEKLYYAHKTQLEESNLQLELWHDPVTNQTSNVKYPKQEQENETSKPKMNILENALREYARVYETPLGQKLIAAQKKAQMAWGNNALEYNKAMEEVRSLERQLFI